MQKKVVQDNNMRESCPNLYFATVTTFLTIFRDNYVPKPEEKKSQRQIAHYLSGKAISMN